MALTKQYLTAIAMILIYFMVNCDCKQQVTQTTVPQRCTSDARCSNSNNNNKNDDEKVLTRRKRALTFPEGSSLQLGMIVELIKIDLICNST
jgi:hypothetical protein